MKRKPLLILICVLFSCGTLPENSTTDILRFELNTVMVDPGDEILYVEGRGFALSPDGRYLYNFNKYGHSLEKIDLDELRLVEKLPFEKEGPNGTVNSIHYLNMLNKNHIHMSDNWTIGQFQLNGTRTVNYDLYNNGLDGEKLTGYEHLDRNIIIPDYPETVFVLVLEDISFSPPVWDNENEKYYRFSNMIEFAEEKEPDGLLPEIKHRNIFLSVYNKDFVLLAEIPIPQLYIILCCTLSGRGIFGFLKI